MTIDLTNFKKISPEKQRTVINAGFQCFGRNGYKKTSVADIAEAAGIAKASLFQYFGTKQDMYLFLYDFANKEVAAGTSEGTVDYFECAEMYIKSLAELSDNYPNLFDFLVIITQRKDASEVEAFLEIADECCRYNTDTIYSKVDWNRFKDGFDQETVQNLFNWFSMGCIAQLSRTMESKQVFSEMLRYLKLFKEAMYKAEYM